MNVDDTIVAVSSAVGPAARMIVRTCGPRSHAVADGMSADPAEPFAAGNAAVNRHATAVRTSLRFADLACPAWVYRFHAPRSYTGDDLAEYHLPGNPVLVGLLLKHLTALGLRPAEPGEFTARAYFNGRLDLTAAEGVAATIAAGSARELDAARGLMAGELARRLAPVVDAVAETLGLLEVGIDFSEEDVTFLSPAEVRNRAASAAAGLRSLLGEAGRMERLAREPEFVLVGRPNAGKSTLLNALAGYDRAVASPTAGTTRDALSAEVTLARGRVRVTDVAGLEPTDVAGAEGDPAEIGPAAEIDRQMRERALRAIAEADFVIHVRPVTTPPDGDPPRPADLIVLSKIDLDAGTHAVRQPNPPAIRVSAVTGTGLPALREAMDALAFGTGGSADAKLALNARHVDAVGRAADALSRAADLADGPAELAAAELREALDALGQVLGHVSPDDVLGRIFSRFCIGK